MKKLLSLERADIMTPEDLAEFLHLPDYAGCTTEAERTAALERAVKALEKWRHTRKGPPWTKIEGRVRYLKPYVVEWLCSQTEMPIAS